MEITPGSGDHAASMIEHNKHQAMCTLLIIVAVYLATWMLSLVLFMVLNAIDIYHCFPCSELISIIGDPKVEIIGGAYGTIVLELNFVISHLLHLWRSKDYRRAMLCTTSIHVTWVAPVIKITNSSGDELPYFSR